VSDPGGIINDRSSHDGTTSPDDVTVQRPGSYEVAHVVNRNNNTNSNLHHHHQRVSEHELDERRKSSATNGKIKEKDNKNDLS
jgi:hypothetical protein